MLQTRSIDDGRQLQDYFSIGGRTLGFSEILNEAFFTSNRIDELRDIFRHNKPFPHIVFDGLFSPVLLELMAAEFDDLRPEQLRRYNNINEKKIATKANCRLGTAAQLYFNTIYSGAFFDFLQRITGIEGLIPDPGLTSGGLHEIPSGGRFELHTDFNQHSVTKLENRLVFITYLNKDWLPSYGGALELWSMDEQKCMAEIQPIFGRSILFAQSSKSLHGHPNPVDAPNGRTRRSAAAYFYTNGCAAGETTLFHTTQFFKPLTRTQYDKISNTIKYLAPPVLIEAIRAVKARLRNQPKAP